MHDLLLTKLAKEPRVAKRSNYQQRVIRDYYKNRDTIAVQKLQELVGELYLAEGKKRAGVWKRIVGHLEAAGMAKARIEHLQKKDDPTLLAHAVQQLAAQG